MSPLQESLMEADRQAEQQGLVWDTLRRAAAEFERLRISYAVLGGIAMQHFGIQRSTQDVDVLIGSSDDLERLHKHLIGHGYHLKSPGSRHLRDDVTRVRIEFLVAGDYPGDGKPKPLAFPKPDDVKEEDEDHLLFVNLKTLIELKLASAKSAPHRIRDRADVLELIHLLRLSPEYADDLNPYVRDEFLALVSLPHPNDDE